MSASTEPEGESAFKANTIMSQPLTRFMRRSAVPAGVTLREVGLRDGLHSLKTPPPTLVKFDWVLPGYAAGLPETEVGLFVSPDVLPQMADTAEVVAIAKTVPDLAASVRVHDRAGARQAFEAGVALLTLPISASAAHSCANVGRPLAWRTDPSRARGHPTDLARQDHQADRPRHGHGTGKGEHVPLPSVPTAQHSPGKRVVRRAWTG